jgi:hypothetical protein
MHLIRTQRGEPDSLGRAARRASASTCVVVSFTALALGLTVGFVRAPAVHAGAAPRIAAVFRATATPQAAESVPSWRFERSGDSASAFRGDGRGAARAERLELLDRVAEACSAGGSLRATEVVADAFDHRFTRFVPREDAPPSEFTEVWWCSELRLPLVIARALDGCELVDELVRIESDALTASSVAAVR